VRTERPEARRSGYLLFEVILAVTVFALAFLGFVRLVNQVSRTANELALERTVHDGLAAILHEAKQRDLAAMALQTQDAITGIDYRTEVEPLALASAAGSPLPDLHRLRAIARFSLAGKEETRTVELWIHRPAAEEDAR
jgi:hypothetical protein